MSGISFGERVDVRVRVVAVAAAEVGAEAVVIAIGEVAEDRERGLPERGAALDGLGDGGFGVERGGGARGEPERDDGEADRERLADAARRRRTVQGAQEQVDQEARRGEVEARGACRFPRCRRGHAASPENEGARSPLTPEGDERAIATTSATPPVIAGSTKAEVRSLAVASACRSGGVIESATKRPSPARARARSTATAEPASEGAISTREEDGAREVRQERGPEERAEDRERNERRDVGWTRPTAARPERGRENEQAATTGAILVYEVAEEPGQSADGKRDRRDQPKIRSAEKNGGRALRRLAACAPRPARIEQRRADRAARDAEKSERVSRSQAVRAAAPASRSPLRARLGCAWS